MSVLFSEEWMMAFGEAWNDEADLGPALAKIDFNSVIGYGYDGHDKPRGFINVEGGFVTMAGAYDDRDLSWDLRASDSDWNKWCDKGLGMMALGVAYTRRKLKFQVGDYGAMIKNPAMAGPFIKSFTVMGTVARD